MAAFIFYPFAVLAVLGALGVVTLQKPTRALLSLIVSMFALAVLFLQLKAPFVAMVHLIVYAGAVLVLFLFVIMLLGIGAKEPKLSEHPKILFLAPAFFVPTAFSVFFLFLALGLGREPLTGREGTPESFGMLLFTRYLLPFELVSFLLLIGVFAAVSLVTHKTDGVGAGLKPAPTKKP